MGNISFVKIPPSFIKGGAEHHGKLNVLISAEVHQHKLAGYTFFLA